MRDYKVGDVTPNGFEITAVYEIKRYLMRRRIVVNDTCGKASIIGEYGYEIIDETNPIPMIVLDKDNEDGTKIPMKMYRLLSTEYDYDTKHEKRKEKIKNVLKND